jgi:hypothetical protein
MTDRFFFDFFCARDVDGEAIIVKEFFAGADVAQGFDEDPAAIVLDRFAIGIAGMIDPARFVAADCGVDHSFSVVKSEIVGAQVVRFLRDARPENAASDVFNDERAFTDGSGGVDTSAVHRRFADSQIFGRAVPGRRGASARPVFPLW